MKKCVRKRRRVQRLATRMMMPGFRELACEERLKRLEMTTLEERRIRGDMQYL